MTSAESGPTAFPIDFYIQSVKTHSQVHTNEWHYHVLGHYVVHGTVVTYLEYPWQCDIHPLSLRRSCNFGWNPLLLSSLVTLVITQIKIRIAGLLCIFFPFINSTVTISSKPGCVLIILLWFLYQHVDELSEGLVWASQGGCLEDVVFLLSTGVEVNSRSQVRENDLIKSLHFMPATALTHS